MSFSAWKKMYQQDHICKNETSLNIWLRLRGEKIIPELKNQQWVCKEKEKLYMIQYTLYLTVIGLEKQYKRKVLSLSTSNQIIHNEYFNIFGNICKIITRHVRIMEYPYGRIVIQKHSIYTTVKPLWEQERSSFKINRFLKQYCNKRRNSLPSIEQINIKKLNLKKLKPIRSVSPIEAQQALTESLKYHNRKKLQTEAIWTTKQYRQKIVQYFVQDKSKNIKKPRLMLIFGLPGSGKNWALEKKRGQDHVIINVDDCRALLPNYWKKIIEQNDTKNEDWIRNFHSECSAIAQDIFKYALSYRMNIVWNGTGKNLKKYRNLMQRAKKENYTVELRYIWVPLSVARMRVNRRASMIGRIVPEEVIKLANDKIPDTFKNLRVEADYARIYSNTVTSPTMVWDKDQGWHDFTPRRRKSISDTALKDAN